LVEAVQVPEDADEDFLNEVFRPLPIPDCAVDEVEESCLVPVHHCAECLGVTGKVAEHQLTIIELMKRLALEGAWALMRRLHPLEDCSHTDSRVAEGELKGATY
jgi:hypothetical protein